MLKGLRSPSAALPQLPFGWTELDLLSAVGRPFPSSSPQPSSSASTGAVPHCSAAQRSEGAAIAIDSKIEQAMDLVKTHLIYAVRDEIELLRTRIVELEATVMQLEIENAILREHIAPELLDGLEKPPPPLQIRTPAQQHTAALAQ